MWLKKYCHQTQPIDFWATLAAITIAVLMIVAATQAEAQTYHVIYNFTGCTDGGSPSGTMTIDHSGNLYGAATDGGTGCGGNGNGVIFRLKRAGSGWIETPIHAFTGAPHDGRIPTIYGGLTTGPDGAFYGTTVYGGTNDLGTIFRLRPQPTACATALCPFSEDVLYSFTNSPDGAFPYSSVTFDAAGTMYGTTAQGGHRFGAVYKATHSGNNWDESVIADHDGFLFAGVTVDPAGNLYGVSYEDGGGGGTLFQLTPSGGSYTQNILHTFTGGNDGANPVAGLLRDSAGNFYGATQVLGQGEGGTVFELSPSGGGWTFNILYSFSCCAGPLSALTMDAAGNLYGTTVSGGAFDAGSVFKLTHSGNSWTYTDLHDFHGNEDGSVPAGGVTLDANGNLFGTASNGGTHASGLVWEITP